MIVQNPINVERKTSLNGDWQIWFDKKADWNKEDLYLTPVDLQKVEQNLPGIGWESMYSEGIPVKVPSTWEEIEPEYDGVAWYWRKLNIPEKWKDKTLRLRFNAVRYRAEVYINKNLAGYSIEGSTPFTVDITDIVGWGSENTIAVRVTDPGGGKSWMDTNPIKFGDVNVPDSHNFGGIWQDVELFVTEKTYINDIFVQPLPDLQTIKVLVSTINKNVSQKATLEFTVSEKETKKIIIQIKKNIAFSGEDSQTIEQNITIENPELWSPEHPFLYDLNVVLMADGVVKDKDNTTFGVRFFTEKNGNLYMNNKRVFIKSAISWGHYPKTIAYPSKELAEREIRSAIALGLNTLSAHRCCITPALLEAADELGLMIYQEPGGAPRDRAQEPANPAEEFEREVFLIKLENLVKRDRNHPSLIWWNCANEAVRDDTSDPSKLKPYIDRMMKLLHETDPSRLKTYTSAWRPTCMFRPYEKEYSLLMDMHTVLNLPAVWKDHLYYEHTHFKPPVKNMVFHNGESRCFTALSDLPLVLKEYGAVLPGSDGAQVKEWKELLEKNFKRFGLSEDFGNISGFCRETGMIQGFGFGRLGEAMRLNPDIDGFALNGWHCHHVLGTSGMVDIFRNPKFNPELLAKKIAPLHIAGIPLPSVAYTGDEITVDQFLINENRISGTFKVELEIVDTAGKIIFRKLKDVEIPDEPEIFVHKLSANKIKLEGKRGYFHVISRLGKGERKILEDAREIFAWGRNEIKLPENDVEFIDPTGHLEDYLNSRGLFWHEFFDPVPPQGKKLIVCNNITLKDNFEFFLKEILERCKKGYADILFTNPSAINAGKLLSAFKKRKIIPDNTEIISLNGHWLGGWEFVKRSHLFYELPNPAVLNWEYEGIFAPWGFTEFPGEVLAGLCNAPPAMGVTAGVTAYGKGKIIFCNFRLVEQLGKNAVADLVFSRFVEFGLEEKGMK